jgi:hypothetical protein
MSMGSLDIAKQLNQETNFVKGMDDGFLFLIILFGGIIIFSAIFLFRVELRRKQKMRRRQESSEDSAASQNENNRRPRGAEEKLIVLFVFHKYLDAIFALEI